MADFKKGDKVQFQNVTGTVAEIRVKEWGTFVVITLDTPIGSSNFLSPRIEDVVLVEAAQADTPASRPFEIMSANDYIRDGSSFAGYQEYVARNTPTVEPAPRELSPFEKILAGANFRTVAEIAPEAIERAGKIREIEKQAAKAADWFAGQQWQKVVVEQGLAVISTEHVLNNRAWNDAYDAEYRRLMKQAGL